MTDAARTAEAPGPQRDPGRRRRVLGGRWLRLAVTAALLALLAATLDLRALAGTLLSARPGPVAVLVGVMLAQRIMAAFRWWLLLRLNDPALTLGPVVRVLFASDFAGQFIPGTLGVEVFRLVGGTRLVGAPAAISSLVVDRLLSTVALATLVLIALSVAPAALRIDAPIAAAGWIWLAVALGASAALLSPRFRRRAEALLPAAVATRLQDRVARAGAALDQYRARPGLLGLGVFFAFIFQSTRVLMYVIAAAALGVPAPIAALIVVIPVVIFLSLLPISVGGFGVREAALAYLLAPAGVPPEGAVAMSLLVFVVHTLSKIPGAWWCAAVAQRPACPPRSGGDDAPSPDQRGVAFAAAGRNP